MKVTLGDGRKQNVIGHGKVSSRVKEKSGECRKLVLRDVLFVLGLSSLLSVSKAAEYGKITVFDEGCETKVSDGNTIAFAERIGSLHHKAVIANGRVSKYFGTRASVILVMVE